MIKHSIIEKPGSCQSCIFRSSAADTLESGQLAALGDNCVIRSFGKGQPIIIEKALPDYVLYVRQGFVKLLKRDKKGRDHVLNLLNEGNYIGLHNLLQEVSENVISVVAIRDTEICFIEKNGFLHLLKNNGEFASLVLFTVCRNELFFTDRLLKNYEHQVFGRLADLLLYLCDVVYMDNPFIPDLTHHEMASYCGISREAATRALNQFRKDGIIEFSGKKIFIKNRIKLVELIRKG